MQISHNPSFRHNEASIKSTPTYIDIVLKETILKLIPRSVTPNIITIFRLVTIPFVLYFLVIEKWEIAIGLFVISAFSDAIDGAAARTRHQITDWGKTFDPLADKLLIGSVVALLVTDYISGSLAVAIIGVELLLMLNGYVKKYINGKVIQAQFSGKIKMILQSVGVGLILLALVYNQNVTMLLIAEVLLYISLFFAVVSLVVYRSI